MLIKGAFIRAGLMALTIALLGSTAILIPSGVSSAATASNCGPSYYFIGARGSSESPQGKSTDYSAANKWGLGNVLSKVYTSLLSQLPAGKTMLPYGVRYPAVSVFGGAGANANGLGALTHLGFLGGYTASVQSGTKDTQDEIETLHRQCGLTRFILAGYSQGAQAVGDALQRMPSKDRGLVVAAAFFGDPYFNADDTVSSQGTFDPNFYGALGVRSPFRKSYSGPVLSYCDDFDPVCDLSYRDVIHLYVRDYPRIVSHARAAHQSVTAVHGTYAIDRSTTDDASVAGLQLARNLGFGIPTPSAPLDLVFCIDSTGSMGGEINDVENNVIQLASTIASSSNGYRFALVDYKDDPSNDSAYQSRVDVPFTTNTSQFRAGVSSLMAEGGGDTPESIYSGVMTALNLPWRTGVKKAVIVIGDAPGKDPEPVTGNTLATVTAKALSVDPAQVYGVPVGGNADAQEFMTSLAKATGGTVTLASDTANFIATLKSAIVQVGAAPSASAGGPYAGMTGHPIAISAAGTRDVSDPVISYDWNFGVGTPRGSYDRTTSSSTTAVTYTRPGTYQVILRARTRHGLSGLATATVTIVASRSIKPASPTGLRAIGSAHAVSLSWSRTPGANYYVVRSGGQVVSSFEVEPGTPRPTLQDTGLASGVVRQYTVAAGNEAGVSAPSRIVRGATTAAVSRTPVAKKPRAAPKASRSIRPSLPLLIAGDSDHNSELPATGTYSMRLLSTGLVCVGIGVVLMVGFSRRRGARRG